MSKTFLQFGLNGFVRREYYSGKYGFYEVINSYLFNKQKINRGPDFDCLEFEDFFFGDRKMFKMNSPFFIEVLSQRQRLNDLGFLYFDSKWARSNYKRSVIISAICGNVTNNGPPWKTTTKENHPDNGMIIYIKDFVWYSIEVNLKAIKIKQTIWFEFLIWLQIV